MRYLIDSIYLTARNISAFTSVLFSQNNDLRFFRKLLKIAFKNVYKGFLHSYHIISYQLSHKRLSEIIILRVFFYLASLDFKKIFKIFLNEC